MHHQEHATMTDMSSAKATSDPTPSKPGPLALVGGDEFHPGNEPHDGWLVRAVTRRGSVGPAFIVASAAAQEGPDQAVATARAWFAGLGLDVEELPLRNRDQAHDPTIVERAREGRFFYLTGGDPGLVIEILERTPAWRAIVEAWQAGAVLAGSSAGALAFGEWTLARRPEPGNVLRGFRDARRAFGLVPGIVVVPHLASVGPQAMPAIRPAVTAMGGRLLGLDERTAAIWSDGEWQALGEGSVVLIDARNERRFSSGELIVDFPVPTRGR
jgi:cyanophycinase